MCVSLQNVLLGQTVAEIWRFFKFFFQNGGRPPSCIRYVHAWTTYDKYLVVSLFITVQNLV